LNRWFPRDQARQRQKSPRNLPRSHAWRNRGRRGITALPPVSVQSPLLSRPINRSHHGRYACAIVSFGFLYGPWAVPADSGEHRRHHRLRRGRPRQGGGADWIGRRAGAQTALAVRDDARTLTRASTVAADAEGVQAADLPTGRIDASPPPRFDPLLSIYPRQMAEINAGAPAAVGRRRRRQWFTLLKGAG
jgi:hypothetical protein